MEQKSNLIVKKDVGEQVISRIDSLCENGFTMPKDYNYVNAIKASVLNLQEVVDMNKKPALEVCTPASIQTALFEMVTKGLDVSLNQAYFIVRGKKLCLHTSYFGHILQARRLYPNWTPSPHVVYEGDVFEYAVDAETGRMRLVEHKSSIDNIDNDFKGAYIYIPCADGTQELYVMSKKQIMTAWSKSSSKAQAVHKEFASKMIEKTIINSACTKIINATPKQNTYYNDDESETETNQTTENNYESFTEAEVIEDAKAALPQPEPTKTEVDAQSNTSENNEEDDF